MEIIVVAPCVEITKQIAAEIVQSDDVDITFQNCALRVLNRPMSLC